VKCRVSGIALALFGSLVLVSLLRNAEVAGAAPAYIIGYNLAQGLRGGFLVFAAPLGALGSFFSGSTTVSNLTFGIVHQVCILGGMHAFSNVAETDVRVHTVNFDQSSTDVRFNTQTCSAAPLNWVLFLLFEGLAEQNAACLRAEVNADC
jgi:L-lactate permease